MQHDFILLDRSGSMDSMWTEALSSINAYVQKLAEDKVNTSITLATFDTVNGKMAFEVIRDNIMPSAWEKVTLKECQPRGMTPLNDAAGRIVSLARAGNYEKVAIIIMTDGYENASRELSIQQVRSMMDDCRSKNWQVIFLGADFDNAQQAASYGNASQATVQVAKGNMVFTSASLASKRAFYGATGQSMSFSDDEKGELKTTRQSP